jgi:hypothetical protein
MDVSNVTVGTHLSISVSGTARLQRELGAKVPLSDTVRKPDETGASALGRASKATLDAIEHALKAVSQTATLRGYKDGDSFYNGAGTFFDIIA